MQGCYVSDIIASVSHRSRKGEIQIVYSINPPLKFKINVFHSYVRLLYMYTYNIKARISIIIILYFSTNIR